MKRRLDELAGLQVPFVSTYQKYSFELEMRKALDRWGQYVEDLPRTIIARPVKAVARNPESIKRTDGVRFIYSGLQRTGGCGMTLQLGALRDALLDAGAALTHRYIRIDAQGGFRSLDLAQLDGTLLALDWVVGAARHIWGSAVMVAPGVALTARHVVDEMRDKGFLSDGGGYLLALGFHNDGMVIWNPDSFTSIEDSDLSILTLTLVRATAPPANAAKKAISVNVATLAARQPLMGESISLVGFAAPETKFENLTHGRGAAVDLLGSVGPVIDVYREGRDRRLPNPSVGVSAKTVGGMSGGAAFDEHGRLIGIITSGIGEETSSISLSWPSVFTPIQVAWPPELVQEPTTLRAMAQGGLCGIDHIEAVNSHVDENGETLVSLVYDL